MVVSLARVVTVLVAVMAETVAEEAVMTMMTTDAERDTHLDDLTAIKDERLHREARLLEPTH
jgi:hypothetical protein